MEKKWFYSKTVWVNLIALVVLFTKNYFGFEVSPEEAGSVLVIINLVLRGFTKQGLTK